MDYAQLIEFLNGTTRELVQKQLEHIAYVSTLPGVTLDEVRFQAGRMRGISDFMEVLAYKLATKEEEFN